MRTCVCVCEMYSAWCHTLVLLLSANGEKRDQSKDNNVLPRNDAATNYKTKMLDFSLAHWQKYPTNNLQIFRMIHFSRTEQVSGTTEEGK